MCENYSDILVIGAGTSALMFGSALKQNAIFLETNGYFGAKLKVSGGGKCNITNQFVLPENYFGNKNFICEALNTFTSEDTLNFLKKHNIYPQIKTDNQYFCNSSNEILNIFRKTTLHHNFFYNSKVADVEFKNGKFIVKTNRDIFTCTKLIVASGGVSFTTLGASDIGYKIAQKFGHTIISPLPALVGLTLQKEQFWMKSLSGVSCFVEAKYRDYKYTENLLFSHKGISGPVIFNISLRWERGVVAIDFLPDFEFKLTSKLWSEKKQLTTILPLPKRFIKAYLESNGLADKPLKNYSDEERQKILKLKEHNLSPAGTFGFSRAEVTRGGVCTDEIDSVTFESKNVKNLYFIGEVLDVTGELGGYNIQWALSSAVSCAKNLKF